MFIKFYFGRKVEGVVLKFAIGIEKPLVRMFGVSFGNTFFGIFVAGEINQRKAFEILNQKKSKSEI